MQQHWDKRTMLKKRDLSLDSEEPSRKRQRVDTNF